MRALVPASLGAVIALMAAANPPSPRTTVEAMFAAFNRHDAAAMASLYSADAMLNSPDFCAPRKGPAEVKRTYAELFLAFPDIRDDGMSYVIEGERVAVQFVARSAKGQMNLPIGAFLVVHNGLIVSDQAYFNAGALPARTETFTCS